MNNEKDFEELALTDKHIQRILEYLTNIGWTAEQIKSFLDYITK